MPVPETIRRNTLYSLAVQLSGAVLTGALTLFLIRRLGPEEYGLFVLALGVGTVVLLPSDFGISRAAARFMAERRGSAGETGRVLGDALSLKLLGSTLLPLLIILLADPIADAYGHESLEWPLRWVAFAVFGQGMMGLFSATFEAMGRNSLGLRLVLSESLIEVGASVSLVLAATGAASAAAGRAIGFCSGAVIGLALTIHLLGRENVRITPKEQWGYRRLARYAGALFVIDGAFALFAQVDVLLIGAILGTSAAGLFGAPMMLFAVFQYPGAALAGGVAPRMARGDSEEPNVKALQSAIRLLLLLQPLLAAPLLVWADPIVRIALGTDYGESADVFRALTPYVLLLSLGPLLAEAVNYLGEARRRVPLALTALGVNAAIDLALLNEIGIVAGAIGTTVAMTIYVGGHLVILGRILDIDFRALALSLARSLTAFAVTCGVLYAVGTQPDLNPALMVAGGACGLVAYISVLLVTRELSRTEMATVLGWIRARTGR